MRKLCFECKGLVYGCLQKHKWDPSSSDKKRGGGGGGAFVARTRMQDVASPTDAGVIVFVNNTQLDAAVQPCFRKASIVHTKELQPPARRQSYMSALPSPERERGGDAVWMLPLP